MAGRMFFNLRPAEERILNSMKADHSLLKSEDVSFLRVAGR
jgi:hypothetical protein